MIDGSVMSYDVYIFDLDGTLLDTLDDLTDSVNAALSAYGCPVRSRSEVRSFVGNGIRLLMERAVPGGAKNVYFSEIFEEFKRHYAEHCCDKTVAYEGVCDLLREISRRGGHCAIVSNKADFAVKQLAKRYFDGLTELAIGENEAAGIGKKPAPDSVFAVLRALKAKNGRAVYIGDSEVDIQTAKNAGLPCVSVTWGFKTRQFLLENGATILVDRPQDVLKV